MQEILSNFYCKQNSERGLNNSIDFSESAKDRFLRDLYKDEDIQSLKKKQANEKKRETNNSLITELSLVSESSKLKRVQSLQSNIFFKQDTLDRPAQIITQDIIKETNQSTIKSELINEELEKKLKEDYIKDIKKNGKLSKWSTQKEWNVANSELIFSHENKEENQKYFFYNF